MAVLAFARTGSAAIDADLSLSASTQAFDYATEDNLTYTLTISNAGPSSATGVIVSNQTPANVNVTSVSAGQVVIQSGLLTVNLGSLPAGQSLTFSVTAQTTGQSIGPASVNPVDLVRAQLTNTFTVSANETDPNPANNSATVISELDSVFPGAPNTPYDLQTLQLNTSNRISLGFTFVPGDSAVSYNALGFYSIPPSYTNFYAFHFNNGSAGDVVFLAGTNASLSATTAMTNWLAVVRFSNPADPTGTLGYPATQDQDFFPLSALDADGFTNFTLFPNVIYITGTETDTNGFITVAASYDEAAFGVFDELDYYAATLTASHIPMGLRLSASAAPEPVVVGSNLVYSLTVSNAMNRLATGVVISNQIPAAVHFVSATGGTVSTNNGVLLIQLAQLAPGASSAVQVVMQAATISNLTNVFRALCNQPDPDPNSGFATVLSTINGVATPNSADVSFTMTTNIPYQDVEITSGNGSAYTNTLLTYSLTVSNAGPAPATGVVISNQIPAGIYFVSATGGTATTNNGTLLVSLGTLAVGATNQVQIVLQPTFQYLVPTYSVGGNRFTS